jgi:hypothetical protein
LIVELHQPEEHPEPLIPPPPDWTGASKQLRDITQWIIGGVVATAAGVFTGTSLSNFGSLDPFADQLRFGLAAGGALLGFGAITGLMTASLAVIAPASTSLETLAAAMPGSEGAAARARIYQMNEYDEADHELGKLLGDDQSEEAQEVLPQLYAVMSFAVVRLRFEALVRRLSWCIPLAVIGFGTFAWAANPPDKPQPERPGISLRITE